MITVFTPVYNRAYILPQLYKSLQEQTFENFEWLIVDDGSTDNVEDLVCSWQTADNFFPIRYYKTANGGKHRAINVGVSKALGEAFFIVDSDDILPQKSLEQINVVFSQIANNQHFCGVCGLKANIKTGKPLGNSSCLPPIDGSRREVRCKYHLRCDMAEVYKTSVLKQYPFPEFAGETFLVEGIVWRKISNNYILRYVPQVWYLCEYLSDGLTQNIRHKYRTNPRGTICSLKDRMTYARLLRNKVHIAVLYWRYLCMQKIGYQNAIWWTYLFWPFGTLICFYDILRERCRTGK